MNAYKPCEIKVPILGEIWSVKLVHDKDDRTFKKNNNYAGYCDPTTREMIISVDSIDGNVNNPKKAIRHTIAHELVHAYMSESGLLNDWEHSHRFGQDETTVDWIAWQLQKMNFTLTYIYGQLDKLDENAK